MRKLSLSKMACFVSVFCAATAILSAAQTKFTSLVSFDGPNGADPHWVYLVQGTDGNLYGTTQAGTGDGGTVFKITTGGTLTTIYTFCPGGGSCLDGDKPLAGLVLATNGNFYGTTEYGGANGVGVVFEITPAGTLTNLHSFDTTDGAYPEFGVIQGTNGDFYGSTTEGGTDSAGTIFQITSGGKFTSLFSFDITDGVYPDTRLVQGTNGDFYGTTTSAGDGVSGTIFDITAAGKLTTLHPFTAVEADGNYGGLIQATNGNFYGTTFGGGNGNGTVYEVTPAGKLTTIYTFCTASGCPDGSAPYAGVIQATDGNLYGTTYSGGISNSGTIFKLTTAGALTTLYKFCSEANCTDGIAPEGGLVQATNGTFYGTTEYGGTGEAGTVFSLSVGLGPFVETLPTSGKVGAAIKILGTNLTGATSVTFDGTKATFKVVSSSEITTTVPTGAKTGTVKVVTPSGTLSSNVAFRVP